MEGKTVFNKAKRQLKVAIKTLDMYSPYPVFYSFIMTDAEKKMLLKYIKDSKNYLEFGAGGSTIKVLKNSKTVIHSVESSEDWLNYMNKYKVIESAKNERLFFHLVDIGKVKNWGFPDGESSKNLFPNYSSAIFNEIDCSKLDTVFVDGRFRVACTLSTIINLASLENLVVLIHDFWIREEYHIVLKYLTEIDRADTLGVFRIKKGIDLEAVKQDYEVYKYVPD